MMLDAQKTVSGISLTESCTEILNLLPKYLNQLIKLFTDKSHNIKCNIQNHHKQQLLSITPFSMRERFNSMWFNADCQPCITFRAARLLHL